MREFLAEVPIPGQATFFCTMAYRGIDSNHELCPHPTLEPNTDWDEVLDRARETFPDARGLRPHSCVYSNLLALDLSRRGYRYLSCHDQFGSSRVAARREAWGRIWHLPIYYMESIDLAFMRHWPDANHKVFAPELLETAVNDDGLYVFDFHPIHLLLNSTSVEAYLSRRDAFMTGVPIAQIRCEGYGVRSYYDDLVKRMQARGLASTRMCDALPDLSTVAATG